VPISAEQRLRIQEQAGVTDEQLEQSIGTFAVDEDIARSSHLTTEQREAIRQEIRQLGADAALIAAKYNAIARRTARNPLREISQEEIDVDRAHLESMLADEYKFINPFGNIEDKSRTIDVILNGRILYSSYGAEPTSVSEPAPRRWPIWLRWLQRPDRARGPGFQATEGSLRIHGDVAVLISAFRMRGQGEARRIRTGEIYEQNLDGTYRTKHTYVHRDGRWQYASSQMTAVPEQRDFVFVADDETY
jgi:hypothetical protein